MFLTKVLKKGIFKFIDYSFVILFWPFQHFFITNRVQCPGTVPIVYASKIFLDKRYLLIYVNIRLKLYSDQVNNFYDNELHLVAINRSQLFLTKSIVSY